MKVSDFMLLCEEICVAPSLALENEKIRQALKERNDEKVKKLLTDEF